MRPLTLLGLCAMIGALYWMGATGPQWLLFLGYLGWTSSDAQVVRR